MTAVGPLNGVQVLDLGQIYAGGYAGFLLATAGADVVKIEPPGGENLRRRGAVGGGAYPFAALNSAKRGLVLDLKSERGKAILRELATGADVVLENFAPGVMDRLGLGEKVLRELNSKLVYGRVTGYGSDGLYRNLPAMDLTVQAMTGVMSTTGYPDRPPVKAGPAICDFSAGVHLYGAIVSALFQRAQTGTGDVVEVTMQESTFPTMMSSLGLLYAGASESTSWRTGNRHSGYAEAPYNTFEASDGYIAILCVTDAHWQSLATIIGGADLASDPRYVGLGGRVQLMDEVDALVAGWAITRTRNEIGELLEAVRVPFALVKELPEVIADPNMRDRGMLRDIEHPELGKITAIHSPMRFGHGPREELAPSPSLGEHSREVLSDLLGYDEGELDALTQEGVI